MAIALVALGALLGACVGSFTAATLDRLRRKESLLWPGSHCVACGHMLAITDNVPVMAYLYLRGCCRYCKAKIPRETFILESVFALASAAATILAIQHT